VVEVVEEAVFLKLFRKRVYIYEVLKTPPPPPPPPPPFN